MNYSVYESSVDDSLRFALGTRGMHTLYVIGVNPHLANQTTLDRTASLVEKVSLRNGYDSFVLLNLYPVRSKTVRDLPRSPDSTVLRANRSCIARHLAAHPGVDVWVAWGNDIAKRAFLQQEAANLAKLAESYGTRYLHYGPLTKIGNPRHPSRLSYSWKFTAFRFPGDPRLTNGA